MKHWLAARALAGMLILTLSACGRSPESIDLGSTDVCMAILRPFCISEEMSAYSISIERTVQDLHSSMYFIKANASDSGELLLVATIEPLTEAPTDDVAEGCSLLKESIPDCEHWSRVLAYEYTPPGWPGPPMIRGIRQHVVARKGAFSDEPNVALPCQLLATGALRCAANLPACDIEEGANGCKLAGS